MCRIKSIPIIGPLQWSKFLSCFLILFKFSHRCEAQLTISADNSNMSYQDPSSQNTFLFKGRHHELPTVSISSHRQDVEIVNQNNTWKVRETLNPATVSKTNKEETLLSISVTATYPFNVYYEHFDDSRVKNSIFRNQREAKNISDESSFRFKFQLWVYLSLMKWQNNSFEFRSPAAPFFGISVRFFYDQKEETVNIDTSPDIPDKFNDYFNWTLNGKKDEECDAFFFVQQSINEDTGKYQRMYDCAFADGKRGRSRTYSLTVNYLRINYEIFRASAKCWRWCENQSLCLEEKLWAPPTYYQWTISGYCETLKNSGDPMKRKNFPPLYMSFPQGETGETEIYFNLDDVKYEKMIAMDSFGDYAYLGSVVQVTCNVSEYFLATPLRFALKHKQSNDLVFLKVEKTEHSWDCNCRSSKYKIKLDNRNIERVICFAPVVGGFDWVNASRPIHIIEPSMPTFYHSSREGNLEEIRVKTFKTNREIELGSENISISCNATGEPLPTIRWIRNHAVLLESKRIVHSHKFIWSQLSFAKVDKTVEGVYTCEATNPHGVTEAYIDVVVPDETNTVVLLSVSIAVVAVVLIVAAGVTYVVVVLKSRKPIFLLTEEECQDFLNGRSNTNSSDPHSAIFAKAFDPKFMIQKDYITLDNKNILGSGQYGIVTKGVLKTDDGNESTVAIKTVKRGVDVMYLKALISEVKIMAHLDVHRNIVGFLGAYVENIKEGEVYAAVEFCENGDLLGWLRKQKTLLTTSASITNKGREESYVCTRNYGDHHNVDSSLPLSVAFNLLKWSRDISCGLAFIGFKNVIHGDLAARNVLISKDNVAKISDFGLSRQLLNDYTTYTKKSVVPLPWKWMALESLTSCTFSVHSDVWAFGMTMWEIFSLGDSPYPGLTYDDHFIRKISLGFRSPKPEFANDEIYKIMLQCWEKDPMSRPDMSSVCSQLEGMLSAGNLGNSRGTETRV